MAFTINRRLSTLVDSNGQLNTGKIPNDYITSDHVADNTITTAMLHTSFTVSSSNLSSIDTDAVSEGSSNLYFTTARVDSHLSGGTGVTYSSGAISIGQAVGTSDSPTFADLTLTGNLNITGDINSYNVTDLDVTDQTITLGAGQIEANSGGSGIIIDGASASILWDETNDEFDINKGLNVTGNLTVDTNTLFVDATNNRVGIGNATPDVSLDIGSFTDAMHVPVGTTAQRPGSPAAGYFRYNSTTSQFEGYTTEWGAIAGSGGSAMETDTFTGDGSTTAFTLSSTATSEDNLIVFIEGVYQNKADYVASGTTITFDVAPVNGRNIVVHHVKDSISGNNMILNQFSGDGSTTAFTLTQSLTSENNSQIYIDGVYQQKDSYTVGGTTLTFDTAPANGTTIEVMMFTQTVINVPTANSIGISELNVSDGTSGQVLTTNGSGTLSFSTISSYTDSDVETYLNTSTIYTDPTNDSLLVGVNSLNRLGSGSNKSSFSIGNTGTAAANSSEIYLYNAATASTRVTGALCFGTTGASDSEKRSALIASALSADSSTNVTGDLQFYTTHGGSIAERMRIDSEGNVRIGYNNSLSYPADADLMISNNGQNGIEFSQTAISGENRILNYNRTTSSYIPLNILGSILKVDCPIQFQNSSSDPSTTAEGSVYWNSTDKKFKYYTGSGWVNLTTPDLTAIPGLDVWADVTEGISGGTIADLSGNGVEGTPYDATNHIGTLGNNTYYNCNSSGGSWITYDRNDFNNYAGDVTLFFVMTNRSSYNSEGSFITQNYQAGTGYHIIRHSGTSDDFNVYGSNVNNLVLSTTNTGLPVNTSYNEGVIIIFSIGTGTNWVIYKKENGSEGVDTFTSSTSATFNFNSNTNDIRIGNSQWAGEYLNAGIFAWGIIDHQITASERQIIYDYYARKGIAV